MGRSGLVAGSSNKDKQLPLVPLGQAEACQGCLYRYEAVVALASFGSTCA